MPKVTISDLKGLVQSSGSGVDITSSVNLGGASELYGNKNNVSVLESAATLTAADSGKVFLLVQTGVNKTVTLPACETGLNLTFVLKTAAANKWEIVQAAGTQDFVGGVVCVADVAGDSAASSDTLVRFVGGAAVAGDTISLVSDGTVWYIEGSFGASGGIIFA